MLHNFILSIRHSFLEEKGGHKTLEFIFQATNQLENDCSWGDKGNNHGHLEMGK